MPTPKVTAIMEKDKNLVSLRFTICLSGLFAGHSRRSASLAAHMSLIPEPTIIKIALMANSWADILRPSLVLEHLEESYFGSCEAKPYSSSSLSSDSFTKRGIDGVVACLGPPIGSCQWSVFSEEKRFGKHSPKSTRKILDQASKEFETLEISTDDSSSFKAPSNSEEASSVATDSILNLLFDDVASDTSHVENILSIGEDDMASIASTKACPEHLPKVEDEGKWRNPSSEVENDGGEKSVLNGEKSAL
ncbi:hypothetical protein KSP40_PGU000633 [Platanthera guangdongensis]|uniref:Uncharacterized protein n=1 Tax=Platanthera guangdongensis TaxID=2320717 RepID=A0ABR2M4Z0_9ASPA